ncbi:MAG: hypothetical protein JO366_10980 [Methylobacteriaceae bacterium]|nr:hypothetical protein [Methylobacteriaceae bacterium]MBV9245322.1 hypothetical protein [Methylobacteriaceae bacterium]MBV9704240.1 hypothetical protein [Methylobacteriaceae bacterium]
MISETDFEFLKLAVELGGQGPQTSSSFSVGCVTASNAGIAISTGYTGEYGTGWHAEEVAIKKARDSGASLRNSVLYSSIEPCGRRLSGRTSCVEHIIKEGITRVVYCLDEPPVFLQPNGCEMLRQAGVIVDRDDRLAPAVLRANRGPMRTRQGAV